MEKHRNQLKKIFDLPENEQLTDPERAELMASVIRRGRQKRHRSIYLMLTAACVLLIGSLFIFYPRADDTSFDLSKVAELNQKRFESSDQIQIVKSTVSTSSITNDPALMLGDVSYAADSILDLSDEPTAASYTTIYVPNGHRQEVTLTDGTRVWLNAGSYLTMDKNMRGKERRVYLNGEAYFDVTHTGKPFFVQMKAHTVEVVGTSFNINSYERDQQTTVELITGKVLFHSNSKGFEKIAMSPGQRIAAYENPGRVVIDKSGVAQDILWTKKQISLNKIRLQDLFRKIERLYNVSIDADPALDNIDLSYSGRLDLREDVVAVLKNIYELRDYQIILKEKEVTIRKPKSTK
ncbi:FecR family protein [Sphingobacterium spiritivorum]|uniref:FecR family protein n=1 Tax=Sphingobacterium spiritivorum TaxID=258 RepID=UPI003DA44470